MSEEDGDDPRADLVRRLTARLDELQVLYTETGNPIYVWEALAGQQSLKRYTERFGGAFNIIVPDWVAEYLLIIAGRISSLSWGLAVEPSKSGPGKHRVVQLKPADAMIRVNASLLGFTTQGGNVFKKRHATRRDLKAAVRLRELRDQGLKREQAIEQIKSETGEVDASVVAKRVARGGRHLEQLKELRKKNSIR